MTVNAFCADATGVWDLIERRMQVTPDGPMLLDEFDRRLTFAEYHHAAEEVAAGLLARGVTAGSTVSWQLPTGIEAAVLIGALARLGAVQNPIITMLRESEVDLIVEQCAPTLLIVPTQWREFDFAKMAEDIAARRGTAVLACDLTELRGCRIRLPLGDPATLPALEASVDAPVRWIFYSSGTTDRPKGVMHTDRAILAAGNVLRLGTGLRDTDLYPMAYPISHIGGPAMLCTQLMVASRLSLFDRFDPATTPELMAAQGPTVLGSGQVFFNAYLDAQERHGSEPLYPKLRVCASGGAPTPPDMLYTVRDKLGGRGITTGYGLTEFPVATWMADDASDYVMSNTVGRLGPGIESRIVDSAGVDVPVGAEGEILLRGPQRFVGYVDARLDATAFDAAGFARTGDLGSIDADGFLRVTGRLKDVIIRNGENISAAEVEQALLKDPAITDVAVIGVPDARSGERVLAFIVAASDAQPTIESVAAACRAQGLARYKVPERIELVDIIPRNSMGKIAKADLRLRAAATV
jgi:cyclohexanecarboxylate-CoA ligase